MVSDTGGAVALSAGAYHSCISKTNGEVSCWGLNDAGQLGRGSAGWVEPAPQVIPQLTDVTGLDAGAFHTCALQSNGLIALCWGLNNYGQLGLGTIGGQVPAPQVVANLGGIAGISTGRFHSCAFETNGLAACWGDNGNGRLGLGTTGGSLPTPQSISGMSDIVALTAGEYHTCALQGSGQVLCWGYNDLGQLGLGITGGDHPAPQPIPGLNDVTSLSAGNAHTCALTTTGQVWCWGRNNSGQLGTGTSDDEATPQLIANLSDVTAISAGAHHTCALQASSQVVCWGRNGDGQLGLGSTVEAHTPQLVPGLTGVTSLSAGALHTCVRKVGGFGIAFAMCWGDNFYGQLGNGSVGHYFTPQTVVDFRWKPLSDGFEGP